MAKKGKGGGVSNEVYAEAVGKSCGILDQWGTSRWLVIIFL
jgi:hypothetical protein